MPRAPKAKAELYQETLRAYIELASAIPQVRMILFDEDSGAFARIMTLIEVPGDDGDIAHRVFAAELAASQHGNDHVTTICGTPATTSLST